MNVSFPILYVEALSTNGMVLGGKALGQELGSDVVMRPPGWNVCVIIRKDQSARSPLMM